MNNQGRDRSIEKLLRSHGGDDIASSMSRECLDPETLAAWMDGELRGAARVAAERHAAGCNRCQALLATMARTTPEIEAAPWRKVSAKWLVPIAFAATALVMWVSVERTRFNPVSSATPQTTASRDELSTVPAGPQSGPALPSQAPNPPAQVAQERVDPKRQLEIHARADEPEKKNKPGRDKNAGSRDAALNSKAAGPPQPIAGAIGGVAPRDLDALQRSERAAADAAARPASPSVAAATPPPQPVATPAPVSTVPSGQQKAAASEAVAQPVPALPASPARAFGAGDGGGRSLVVPVEITSPDPRYRWRIIPPAGIRRSTDDGATWAVVDPIGAGASAGSRAPAALVAGSSPARDICWIVGRSGLVLLSVDGATWRRRPLPEAVDLVSVRGVSASTAEVTAADGRRFATADGGATWTLVK